MKKVLILYLFLLLLPGVVLSEVFWTGYYETELEGYQFPDNSIYTNYHKFRLNMDTSPSRNIKIGGNLIYKNYEMDTEYNIMEFLPPKYRSPGLQSLKYTLNDTVFVDNLFLKLHHKYFDLILGKQQLPIGVGYAWNPTDIFNEKDIFDPTYENRGHNALQFNIPLGINFTFTGIIQPESDFDRITQYYEMKGWLGRFDLSLSYARAKHKFSDLQKRTEDKETREIGGFSAEGELFGLGLRTEVAANRFDYADLGNLKYEYIAGLDYTFKNSLYVLSEYHHNDLGAKSGETGLNDYYQYFQYEKKSVNKNYIFGLVQYPVTDLIDLSLSGISNLDDRSGVINPEIIYRLYQDVELILRGNYFVGEKNDEFGYQNLGGMIRLRAYF